MALFILIAVVILVVVGILLVKDCTRPRPRENSRTHGSQPSSKNVFAEKLREQMSLAQRGDARAQYMVAAFYLAPDGIMNNVKEGLKWLRLSADQGYCDALYMLGSWLMTHYSTEAEKKEATGWILMAAKLGHPKAVEVVKDVVNHNSAKPIVF